MNDLDDADDGRAFLNSLVPASDSLAGTSSAAEDHLEPPLERLWRDERDGEVPTIRIPLGPEVPDLARIERESWGVALAPFSAQERSAAGLHAHVGADALDWIWSLPPAPSQVARRELRRGPRLPSPSATQLRRGRRQVNVSLSPDDHDALVVAASVLGGRPTEIARILILNGVRRVLAEHDAAAARFAPADRQG